eukprot:CAMPEP_0119414950 /NCGR_PEP_ID=MMETSP1335-20130426/7263_1 /TAXON_ID=259385 /ORGANISM="Chrysoculter rhomboideus, Strain RCC1486" /LENGTH=126 /DNA_ID=CAMNT_0007439847 /DNA_START=123 /DNA_END=504 /DNA_ORIENTATION=-
MGTLRAPSLAGGPPSCLLARGRLECLCFRLVDELILTYHEAHEAAQTRRQIEKMQRERCADHQEHNKHLALGLLVPCLPPHGQAEEASESDTGRNQEDAALINRHTSVAIMAANETHMAAALLTNV